MADYQREERAIAAITNLRLAGLSAGRDSRDVLNLDNPVFYALRSDELRMINSVGVWI